MQTVILIMIVFPFDDKKVFRLVMSPRHAGAVGETAQMRDSCRVGGYEDGFRSRHPCLASLAEKSLDPHKYSIILYHMSPKKSRANPKLMPFTFHHLAEYSARVLDNNPQTARKRDKSHPRYTHVTPLPSFLSVYPLHGCNPPVKKGRRLLLGRYVCLVIRLLTDSG